MSSNLPDGVTPGMIPGNRPEDEWLDNFYDAFVVPGWVMEQWNPQEAADWLGSLLQTIENATGQAYKVGHAEGHQDAQFDQAEVERQKYEEHREQEAAKTQDFSDLDDVPPGPEERW